MLSAVLAACGSNGGDVSADASAGNSQSGGSASTDESSPLIGAPSDDPAVSGDDTTDTSSSSTGGNEYEFKGIIFTEDYRAVEPFGGSYENGQLFARYLNRYRHFLGDDINIYNMIIPTAAAYYMPTSRRNIRTMRKKSISAPNTTGRSTAPTGRRKSSPRSRASRLKPTSRSTHTAANSTRTAARCPSSARSTRPPSSRSSKSIPTSSSTTNIRANTRWKCTPTTSKN